MKQGAYILISNVSSQTAHYNDALRHTKLT